MKAVEVMGNVDEQGHLILDEPIAVSIPSRVRVIVLFSELIDVQEGDPDNDDTELVKASLRRALQQAKDGQRLPIAQMWDGINAE
jgi:hypothetical protein